MVQLVSAWYLYGSKANYYFVKLCSYGVCIHAIVYTDDNKCLPVGAVRKKKILTRTKYFSALGYGGLQDGTWDLEPQA